MFNASKYTRVYFQIIEKAVTSNRVRLSSSDNTYIYYEEHHIIPKSLGGSNKKENLVLLLPREHFICHWLLTKMVITSVQYQKMLHAFSGMYNWKAKRSLTGRQYNTLKIHSKRRIQSEESNKKRSVKLKGRLSSRKGKSLEEFYGNKETAEVIKNKISIAQKGKPKSKYKTREGSSTSIKCTDGLLVFNSIKDMATYYNTQPYNIKKLIESGVYKTI
jgi:hypothetical protein